MPFLPGLVLTFPPGPAAAPATLPEPPQSAFNFTQALPGAKTWQSASLAQTGGPGGTFHPMAGEQNQWPSTFSTQKLKHGCWQNWKLLQSSGAHGLQGSP